VNGFQLEHAVDAGLGFDRIKWRGGFTGLRRCWEFDALLEPLDIDVKARLIRLERPIPPTPTAAMFSVSLGGVNPRPRTLLGTMAHAAPLAAALARKTRREIVFFLLINMAP
jgi:hypothetical protein